MANNIIVGDEKLSVKCNNKCDMCFLSGDCPVESMRNSVKELAAHKREIDELKKQVSIAKDAFFKIAQRKHSQAIHDIVCEAEFMMNHPECRNEVSNV